MSHITRKIPVFLLAFALLFTCAFAEEDQTVIATYDGGEVKISDVSALVDSELNAMVATMSYIYQMQGASGYTPSAEDVASVRKYVVEGYIQQKIVFDKLGQLGLTDLTEEEKAVLMTNAEYAFSQYAYPYYVQYGYSFEDITAILASQGMTVESIYEQYYNSQINQRVANALEIDEEISDEELTGKYDQLVSSAEKKYTSSPASVESVTNSGESVYYMPEGVKYVKHIILIPEDEALMTRYDEALADLNAYESELATITSDSYVPRYEAYVEEAILVECKENIELTKAEIELIKDEVFMCVQADADKILFEIESGADFDHLIETYSADPGSKSEPIKSNGYLVHKDSTSWDKAFIDAANALENVGDVSEPAVGTLGVYIVKYESAPETGAVEMDSVRDSLVESILSERRSAAFQESVMKWYEEANVQLNLEAWQ